MELGRTKEAVNQVVRVAEVGHMPTGENDNKDGFYVE